MSTESGDAGYMSAQLAAAREATRQLEKDLTETKKTLAEVTAKGEEREAKLSEFRDNGRGREKKLTEVLAENAALKAQVAEAEGVLPAATEKLTAAETKAAELAAALDTERAAHASTRFANLVSFEVLKAGARPEAVPYFIERAKEGFELKDGQLTAKAISGVTPGTLAEWVAGEALSSAFAFRPSTGGGARPATGGAVAPRLVVGRDPVSVGQNLQAIAEGKAFTE